jgi:hypothetical protein
MAYLDLMNRADANVDALTTIGTSRSAPAAAPAMQAVQPLARPTVHPRAHQRFIQPSDHKASCRR